VSASNRSLAVSIVLPFDAFAEEGERWLADFRTALREVLSGPRFTSSRIDPTQ